MDPIEYPIDGTLDLHHFRPNELGDLIPDYLEACIDKGIYQVRIVHGKGIGTLRTTVHTLLKRSPMVESFGLCDESGGGWGATWANLIKN